jgi:anti-sigma regulatory factor (Ser/Thr protein kinase)
MRVPEKIIRVGDIEHFHWMLSEADAPVSFSTNGSALSLAAAVELASIEAHLSRAVDCTSSSIRVTNCSVWSLVKASHWPTRRGRTKLRTGAVAVLVLTKQANDTWWTECLRDLLKELIANGFPTNLARGLTGAVAEMVDNVWQHSDTPAPGLVAYQIRRRKLAFSVADTGIGVLASLRKNPRYEWLNSSMDGIRHAIRPGVSRFNGGGMGFASLLRPLADLWGNARLRSGEASLLIDSTRSDRKMDFTYLPSLPGLHVSVRCALDAPPPTQR